MALSFYPHKYRAKPQTVDNIRFSSKAEAARYEWLKLRQQLGEISHLRLQPRFALHAVNLETGEMTQIGLYIADFQFREKGADHDTVEDVKGMRLPLFKWKSRHLLAEYGIRVSEVR